MNTSAIAPSAQPITPGNRKMSSQDATSADTNFGKLLTREIAERNPKDRQVSVSQEPVKQSGNATQASQDSAEDASTKPTAESEQAAADPSTEQLLMMAAQFSSAQQGTSTASATTTIPAPTAEPTANSPMAVTAPQLDAVQPTADKNAQKADSKSASDASSFDATLGHALDKNLSTEDNIERTNAANAMPPKAATTADLAALTAASQASVEISAEKTQETRPDLSVALASIQQTAASHAQSAGASGRIAPQIGTPAWNNAISQKVVWMLGNEQQSASLTLNPPDLGPLQVVLSVSSTQANASFYSSQAEVRQALEAALPRLREMLGDAGIQLGQANVNAGSPQHQGTHAEFQPASRIANQTGDTSILPVTANANRMHIVREGLIDTFA